MKGIKANKNHKTYKNKIKQLQNKNYKTNNQIKKIKK